MTEPISPAPISEDDLAAWVDGRLPPRRRAVVEAYLAAHPDVDSRLARYREQEAALAGALRAKFEEPLPGRLRVAP
ncbi:MAG: anti-sigma factor, partial [Methylobacterium sp.]